MLTLQIGSSSVSLKYWLAPFELPRTRTKIAELNVTSTGVNVGTGTLYEPMHIWNIDCVIDDTQMKALKAIYAEHDAKRRIVGADADILINDSTELYEEYGARTRGIVAGTTPLTVGGCTLYYAQFKAWFIAEPRFTKPYHSPTQFQVRATLQESTKVLA